VSELSATYNWINESNTDFNLHFGEKKLYLIVEWIDGASLFIEDYSNFMNENMMKIVHHSLDEDTDEEKVFRLNKLFGIGSEWHGIADKMLDALESQTADLNKMDKERYI
jgi:hypothetical protein